MNSRITPPRSFLGFFRWFCDPAIRTPVEGDLLELYDERLHARGKKYADRRFIFDVLLLFRPGIIRSPEVPQLNNNLMLRNYLKITTRNLSKNKPYSVINIGGLAIGMAVAMLIGLWVYDEFSFNTYHKNYDRVVQIMKGGIFEGRSYQGQRYLPYPLIETLRTEYGQNFSHVMPMSDGDFILSLNDKNISKRGIFIDKGAPEAFTLEMIEGTWQGLEDPHSIMLSAATAKDLFGDDDPMNKTVQINNNLDMKVTGVYSDLPFNTTFHELQFMAPWAMYDTNNPWMKQQDWKNHFLHIYAEIAPNLTIEQVNANIREAEIKAIEDMPDMQDELKYGPIVLLHPMSRWHLYSDFKEGVVEAGPIQSVRMIALIGGFVLLLACINFMNLSTSRSEKRAKEVGIRKSVGSLRTQLIGQFFTESFMVVVLAFMATLLLVTVALPWFNDLAAKQMQIPWSNANFWLISLGFILLTGILAGSYPALYLSSFNAHRVLKGTFRAGRLSSLPRKALVVLQFTVSVALIIATVVIHNQVIYAKDRPVGYTREGVIMVERRTGDFYSKLETLRTELMASGAVKEMATSGGRLTQVWSGNGGFTWQGMDPGTEINMSTLSVSADFGKTVGWQFVAGRDFSRDIVSDSAGFVLNETAIREMNLEDPVGKVVHWSNTAYGVDRDYRVLGVIKDMVMQSPYEKVDPAVFFIQGYHGWINIKLNPDLGTSKALATIEGVFKEVIPGAPFDYTFADEAYATKFATEERLERLASVFAALAIFISCLGLFGLASYMAERRTKEIGIRKVIGASVFILWRLLCKDFVLLAFLGCILAAPAAYYPLTGWLRNFTYRTEMSWWIFVVAGVATIALTLLTVSYQTIKAATGNPVNSLRSE